MRRTFKPERALTSSRTVWQDVAIIGKKRRVRVCIRVRGIGMSEPRFSHSNRTKTVRDDIRV